MKTFQDLYPYSDLQWTPNGFSAASKSYKQYQTINKCLIYRNDQWFKKIKQMYMLYKHTNARLFSMCVPDFT